MADFVDDLEIAHQIYTIENIDVTEKMLKVYFQGDENTPYHDGFYEIVITFKEDYPESAPTAVFTTPIWSPRVDPHSSQVLFDDGHYNVSEACEFVRSAMDVFMRGSIGDSFDKTAEFWTSHFAGGNKEKDFEYDAMLTHMMDLGFPEKDSLIALSNTEFKIDFAIDELLNQQETLPLEGPIAYGEAGPSGLPRGNNEEDAVEEEDLSDFEEGEAVVGDSSKNNKPGSPSF